MNCKPITLLIDGDVVLYRNASACEVETHWGDDLWTLHTDLREVKAKVLNFIESLKETLHASKVIIALSCPSQEGFRKALCPTYKANREGKRKPLGYPALRQWAKDELGARMVARLEADDIIGIEATRPIEETRIVVSIDKDFRGVPCYYYNPFVKEGEPEIETITPREAARFHFIQTLAGDSTDGYSGCPGIGPVKAAKIIDSLPEGCDCWATIVDIYAKAGFGEEEALLSARLARICQFEDYNPKTNSIRLWTPGPKTLSPLRKN